MFSPSNPIPSIAPTSMSGQTGFQTGQTGFDLLGGLSPLPPPTKQEPSVPDPFAGADPFGISNPYSVSDPFTTPAPDPMTVLTTLNVALDTLKPSEIQ